MKFVFLTLAIALAPGFAAAAGLRCNNANSTIHIADTNSKSPRVHFANRVGGWKWHAAPVSEYAVARCLYYSASLNLSTYVPGEGSLDGQMSIGSCQASGEIKATVLWSDGVTSRYRCQWQ